MNYNQAVMSSRREPPDSADFFPTPPWGTRALMEYVMPKLTTLDLSKRSVWEPACGEGHMAEPLQEYFGTVYASDVHDYGKGYSVGSFVGQGIDVAECPFKPDFVITNPPFTLAEEFVRRAMAQATLGVAILGRSVFIESAKRYALFSSDTFQAFAPFCERLPMVKGRWDPKASSATSYAWFCWLKVIGREHAKVILIPPGAKEACSHPSDIERFANGSSQDQLKAVGVREGGGALEDAAS